MITTAVQLRRDPPTVTIVRRALPRENPFPSPVQVVERRELRAVVDRVVASLPAKEATILSRYFGLDGDPDGDTLDDIGQEFGLCVERIRQIKARALRTIRHSYRRRELGIYVGLYTDDDYARFLLKEQAARREADEARWAAQSARYAAERAQDEVKIAARRAERDAKREQERLVRVEARIKSLGEVIGDIDPMVCAQLTHFIADILERIVNSMAYEVRSESECRDYFAKYRDSSRRSAAFYRDVGHVALPVAFTHAITMGGSFMLYARSHDPEHDHTTWYLCDMPDGLRWIGFTSAERVELA